MGNRKAKPIRAPRRHPVPPEKRLTGEMREGTTRIAVKPGLWVESKRKPEVVRAEFQAKLDREMQGLKSKNYNAEYKQHAYQKQKERKRGKQTD